MKHGAQASYFKKYTSTVKLYNIASILFVVIVAVNVFSISRLLLLPNPQPWTFSVLWLSIRDNYFITDPITYIIQWSNAGYGVLDVEDVVVGVVGIFIISVIFFALMVTAFVLLKAVIVRRTGSVRIAYKQLLDCENDALLPYIKTSYMSVYNLRLHSQGRAIKAACYGSTVVFIVESSMLTDSLQILIDSKKNNSRGPESGYFVNLDKSKLVVIDGVSSEHFKIYTNIKLPRDILKILDAKLLDTLIRHGFVADIQIINGKAMFIANVESIKKSKSLNEYLNDMVIITKAFEESISSQKTSINEVQSTIFDPKKVKPNNLHNLFRIVSLAIVSVLFSLNVTATYAHQTMLAVAVLLTCLILAYRKNKWRKW